MEMILNKQPIIILHWLESSRSQRITWLLVELGIEFELKLYHRTEDFRASPKLKEVSPLGKAPVLELQFSDHTKQFVMESGHIINFLIKHFDVEHKLKPATDALADEADYYLHFAEGSLQGHLTSAYVNNASLKHVPMMVKPIISKFVTKLNEAYNVPGALEEIDFLEAQLAKKGEELTSSSQEIYFVGNKLSAADIILSYPVAVFFSGRIMKVDASKYPMLSRWMVQLKNRPQVVTAENMIATVGGGKFKVVNHFM